MTGVISGVALIAASLLSLLIVQRAADGRLRKNAWMGLRTFATTSSDEAWLAAHRAGVDAVRVGAIVGAAGGFLAVVLTLAPLPWWLPLGAIVVGLGSIIVLTLVATVRGHRAAKIVRDGG